MHLSTKRPTFFAGDGKVVGIEKVHFARILLHLKDLGETGRIRPMTGLPPSGHFGLSSALQN